MSEDLQRGTGPGQWEPIVLDPFDPARRRWHATIYCRDCGNPFNIHNHTIRSDGQVVPSMGLPAEHISRAVRKGYAPCTWHPTPRLIGWNALGPVPPMPPPCGKCVDCASETHILSGWTLGNGGLHCPTCWHAMGT